MEIDEMPTYEYKCLKCNHRFELFQKITDDPVTVCPECKGEVKRLISGGAGSIFKGTGFYQTDYKNAGRKSNSQEPPKSETETKKTDTSTKKD
jgi:putative FmdB family regulatory protein